MENENIFWDLFKSDSEKELEDVINNKYSSLFNNDANWKPLAGDKHNLKDVNNQQSSSTNALAEKVVNSMDALLSKGCHLAGIDPKGEDAPKSMKKAVEKFWNVQNGDLNSQTKKERGILASNIQLIATGNTFNEDLNTNELHSLLLYDNGIGVKHDEFEKTFLSIGGGSKSDIHFLQGKWNMGGTGAYPFCGENHYQLIGSMRYDDSDKEFGFTLVREHPYNPDDSFSKDGYYEYFCPGGKIPFFKFKSEPDFGLDGDNFKSGSIIKMYSYDLSVQGDISTHLWRELQGVFYDPPLPFRTVDNRTIYRSNIIVIGNRNSFETSKGDDKYIDYEFAGEIDMVDYRLPYKVYVLSAKAVKEPRMFMGTKSTFRSLQFLVNGQVHYFKSKTFFSQDLKLDSLKKYTQVIVDFTNVPYHYLNKVFQANRTSIFENNTVKGIMDALISSLSNNKDLRRINDEKQQSIGANSKDGKDLLNELVKEIPGNKSLMSFLNKDGKFDFLNSNNRKNGNNQRKKQETIEQPVLKRFPTIFKLKENKNGKSYRGIPINDKGKFEIETDVQNDYIFRTVEKGKLTISVLQGRRRGGKKTKPGDRLEVTDKLSVEYTLNNGTIKLIAKPTKTTLVGDELSVKVKLTAPDAENGYMEIIFNVKVDPEIAKPDKVKKVRKKINESFPQIPGIKYAYEEIPEGKQACVRWDHESLGWDGKDIVELIIKTGEDIIETIIVNMDSLVLKQFMRKKKIKTDTGIEIFRQKYWAGVYLESLFLYSINEEMKTKNENLTPEFDTKEWLKDFMKKYAEVILYQNSHIYEAIED